MPKPRYTQVSPGAPHLIIIVYLAVFDSHGSAVIAVDNG
ncbi:hypothetical protein MNBD_GAMMA11-1926 [hydrothermal vent metagenome]|uniref:Uncharacterized protein n=1 Tax=hydrothermal vent metagenome TaxID=652676 RepID=A0A3B0WUV9_9ZZZZ